MTTTLAAADVRRAAAARLRTAGVPSPEWDADELLVHVLGAQRSQLPVVEELTEGEARTYLALIDQRADRIPLQHLTGTAAFRHTELLVGPGVFIPRPETELLAGWAIDAVRAISTNATDLEPIVVDLCTGSGAIAKAVAQEAPQARVYAVELDERALVWARRNLADTPVDLRHGDMATAFDELLGQVDVIACNPPYIPLDAWESVAPEARDHDPEVALFSGVDGLDAFRVLERRAACLLRPGGRVGAEHADAQGEAAPQVFTRTQRWTEVVDHLDLANRPRFVTARLAG
ncbi:MAG: peptide chain release factor N(5)-glutamine methyltransferase [Nocardioides sp.]|uniref:peptide chain release factor N(5)-glutamine methyltransferase n=1 Tax=Nocardioides sp. TaxID=35761 RepID=UPI0039E40FBD